MRPPEVCPNCGTEVPRDARACPECGSDWETGWSEDAAAQNLGLPEDNFNYEDFVDREFGGKKPVPQGINPFWWFVAVLLLLAFLWYFVF